MIRSVFALLITCASLAALPLGAQTMPSADAVALMEAEVSQACGGLGGHQITTNGFLEHDFTGDGVRDLLLQHSEITCAGGRRSDFCGAQVCTVKIWIRAGGQLVLALDTLGIVTEVTGAPIPVLEIYPHGGPALRIRWTGAAFSNL